MTDADTQRPGNVERLIIRLRSRPRPARFELGTLAQIAVRSELRLFRNA